MDIREVSFSYDQQRNIVQSVTTRIEKGKITTIIGPNGSGQNHTAFLDGDITMAT